MASFHFASSVGEDTQVTKGGLAHTDSLIHFLLN